MTLFYTGTYCYSFLPKILFFASFINKVNGIEVYLVPSSRIIASEYEPLLTL